MGNLCKAYNSSILPRLISLPDQMDRLWAISLMEFAIPTLTERFQATTLGRNMGAVVLDIFLKMPNAFWNTIVQAQADH